MSVATASDSVLQGLDDLLGDLEGLYEDIHSHPELSMQEKRTAGLAAERLKAAEFEVTEGVGQTGVVGLLKNGKGPTVMLRADMDALPVKEDTGLPYASLGTASDGERNETPVMHACGDDMHVTWLRGGERVAGRRQGHLARHADGGLPARGGMRIAGLRYGVGLPRAADVAITGIRRGRRSRAVDDDGGNRRRQHPPDHPGGEQSTVPLSKR